jgi:thiol-disulfide isomerase/thioredoxin
MSSVFVVALLTLTTHPCLSARVKEVKVKGPTGGRPMGGLFAGLAGGIGGLRKTDNLANLEERAKNRAVLSAPIDIEDAVFVNCPEKNTLTEIFEARGAKLLLVDFFAFSCTNCIRAGKTIHDLYEKFSDKGLEVLAFARPEFKFEGDRDEVAAWIQRNHVKFDVVTDVQGTNWRNWKVDSWPTHFLVQKDQRSGHEGEFVISYTHVGDRSSHKLYNEIIKTLTPEASRVPPMNTQLFTDVEIFLGDAHKSKNTGDGCNKKTKACNLVDVGEADIEKAAGLPLPNEDRFLGKILVYGTGYCPFCRMTKALLGLADVEFDYIDLLKYGGPASGLALLKKEGLMPESHKTIPAVFGADGSFLGGYTDTKALYPSIDEEEVKRATPAAPVSPEIEYKKYSNDAIVSFPKPEQWAGGKEGMTALVDGAELRLSANLLRSDDGISLYVVCGPGVIDAPDGESKQIDFSGRHYIGSFANPIESESTTFSFSKGMKVYVFWLSTEPVS